MVNPLQAQLLKAGLVNADQLKKAAREKRHTAKRGAQPDHSADQAREAQQQKAQSDRIRNREQQQERDRKAQAAQIRQLIETQRVDRKDGELTYQFVDAGKIKKIDLHEEQRAQLIKGRLAVVRLGASYELVPIATCEKIALRDPTCVVVLNARSEPQTTQAPDPYADFSVPDDLVW